VNQLTGHLTRLRNRYFLMRHGQSKANAARLIVSSLATDASGDYGLTELGRQQALASARRSGLPRDTVICSSPFARARQTAEIVREHLRVPKIAVDDALAERFFGDFDQTSTANYDTIWADDQAEHNAAHGVEPVSAVFGRIAAFVAALDREHDGDTILLVSHGDALQILLTGFLGLSPEDHRRVAHLETAEIRPANQANGTAPAGRE
jgi:probable phosphoglycerate mutase